MYDPLRHESAAGTGVVVGHWTDHDARTGCTVVLFDQSVPAVVDVRGGAPGTRETDLLGPDRLVRQVDAIALCGGSAFGLSVADGVMGFLRDRGQGVATSAGVVPIVSAGVIFDLAVGQPIAPTAVSGLAACRAAVPLNEIERGQIGVGVGATSDKLTGNSQRGGFGVATVAFGAGQVTALVVVNAVGAIVDSSTGRSIPAGDADRRAELLGIESKLGDGQATTLGVIVVDAPVDDVGLRRCAIAAHDAFARGIRPCHTIFDGDLVFAAGLKSGTLTPSDILTVTVATELAMERAIIDAVTS